MMYTRALQLDGIYDHQTWPIPIDENLTPYRQVKLALIKLFNDPQKMDFLRTINVKWVNALLNFQQHLILLCDK